MEGGETGGAGVTEDVEGATVDELVSVGVTVGATTRLSSLCSSSPG
jgi:hypothetical protein